MLTRYEIQRSPAGADAWKSLYPLKNFTEEQAVMVFNALRYQDGYEFRLVEKLSGRVVKT